MAEKRRKHAILYGGDYNPNQWPEDVWESDLKLFEQAHINTVTLNVFSWASLQTDEETYDFSSLDKMIDLYSEAGFDIILGTSTAALPAWMVKKYPEVMRVDFEGRRHRFGRRHNACPNSRIYQDLAVRLVSRLAQRYGDNPHVSCWHINNEYGGECYCRACEQEFRKWLKNRYKTLEQLNEAWYTEFWSHKITDWDEIVVPNILSEAVDAEESAHEGISEDYRRFNSDSMLHCLRIEKQAIRKYDSETPVTTNMMREYQQIDCFSWADDIDIASWDNYPSDKDKQSTVALWHDLMRGLKKGDSFLVMEQNPTQQTYVVGTRKEPGKMRSWSYQALAHGADGVLFFQLKRSAGSTEKYCGAVIDHVGHGNTRIFREVESLGSELEKIGLHITGTRIKSQAALIFDWESYWGIGYDSKRGVNPDWNYLETVRMYYDYFYRHHISLDIVPKNGNFNNYAMVIAPMLYVVSEAIEDQYKQFVSNGGHMVFSYGSGLVRDTMKVILGGYPGALRDILGIWVEEIDYLPKEDQFELQLGDKLSGKCRQQCDVIHLQGAARLASFGENGVFYDGMPAITENAYGEGMTWYVGTCPETAIFDRVMDEICSKSCVRSEFEGIDQELEISVREKEGNRYVFVLNHNRTVKPLPEQFVGDYDLLSEKVLQKGQELKPFEVLIIDRKG